jgi:hypothetical protein
MADIVFYELYVPQMNASPPQFLDANPNAKSLAVRPGLSSYFDKWMNGLAGALLGSRTELRSAERATKRESLYVPWSQPLNQPSYQPLRTSSTTNADARSSLARMD